MIILQSFDRIDHLMIEVNDPQAVYDEFCQVFALPQAWPLITTEKYTSIGINFGNTNIELISFSERFGIKDTQYSGLSGVCLTSQFEYEKVNNFLATNGINLLDGEDTPGYTTIVITSKESPTIFVCYYKFNTDGWKAHLQEEFEKTKGGIYGVSKVDEVCIDNPLLEKCEFKFNQPNSVRLGFAKKPEVRLVSVQDDLIGRSMVVGDTLFTFNSPFVTKPIVG